MKRRYFGLITPHQHTLAPHAAVSGCINSCSRCRAWLPAHQTLTLNSKQTVVPFCVGVCRPGNEIQQSTLFRRRTPFWGKKNKKKKERKKKKKKKAARLIQTTLHAGMTDISEGVAKMINGSEEMKNNFFSALWFLARCQARSGRLMKWSDEEGGGRGGREKSERGGAVNNSEMWPLTRRLLFGGRYETEPLVFVVLKVSYFRCGGAKKKQKKHGSI